MLRVVFAGLDGKMAENIHTNITQKLNVVVLIEV